MALTERTLKRNICSWLPRIYDSYIGFCKEPGDLMSEFNARGYETSNDTENEKDDLESTL